MDFLVDVPYCDSLDDVLMTVDFDPRPALHVAIFTLRASGCSADLSLGASTPRSTCVEIRKAHHVQTKLLVRRRVHSHVIDRHPARLSAL